MLLILFSFGIPKNRKTGQRKENRTQQLIGRDSVRFTFELSLTRALNYNSSTRLVQAFTACLAI